MNSFLTNEQINYIISYIKDLQLKITNEKFNDKKDDYLNNNILLFLIKLQNNFQ